MLMLLILLLLLAHAIPWFSKKKIVKSPYKLFSLISFFHIFPSYLIVSYDPTYSNIFNLIEDFEASFYGFSIYYSFSLALLYCGILFSLKVLPAIKFKVINKCAESSSYSAGLFLLFFAFLLLLVIVSDSGGIVSFVLNMGARAQMLQGKSWFLMLMNVCLYLSVFIVIYTHFKSRSNNLIRLVFFILLAVVISSFLGGRRLPVSLLIFSVIYISILSEKFRFFSIIGLSFGACAIFVFSGLYVIRHSFLGGEVDSYALFDINYIDILLNSSFNDIYIFIISYFDSYSYWYGAGFFDIFRYFFFSCQGGFRIPLDDGVYIFNNFLGYTVRPPECMSNMIQNSWPGGSFGMGFVNFGFIGSFLFMFVTGLVIGFFYKIAVFHKFSPPAVLLYLWIVFTFQISNLGLIQFFLMIIYIYMLIFLVLITSRIRRLLAWSA